MTTEKLREALEPFAQLSFEDGMMRGLDPEQFQAAVADAREALGTTAEDRDESYYGEGAFHRDLERVINRHARERGSGTPDWILAKFLWNCLTAFDVALTERAHWYGRDSANELPLTVDLGEAETSSGEKAPPAPTNPARPKIDRDWA